MELCSRRLNLSPYGRLRRSQYSLRQLLRWLRPRRNCRLPFQRWFHWHRLGRTAELRRRRGAEEEPSSFLQTLLPPRRRGRILNSGSAGARSERLAAAETSTKGLACRGYSHRLTNTVNLQPINVRYFVLRNGDSAGQNQQQTCAQQYRICVDAVASGLEGA